MTKPPAARPHARPIPTMPIRFLVFSLATFAVFEVRGASTPRPVPRSFEMAISSTEMVAVDGGLQPRAIAALQRMNAMARDTGVELIVQVPADAVDAAAEIQRVAPFSSIKQVAARRPFKLVLRSEKPAEPSGPGHGSRNVSSVAEAPSQRRSESSPYVYIHIRHESELDAAREHASQLRQMGVEVSDVEILVAEGPRSKQLRYFHAKDRKEAAALAAGLNVGPQVQLLDLSREYAGSVPPRHYELWLPSTINR